MAVPSIPDPNASILWRDGTLANDKTLLKAIVQKRTGGDERHWDECVEKIIATIRAAEWQKKFDHRIFVFNVYFAQLAPVVDISFALSCQALEALFFTLHPDKKYAASVDGIAVKLKFVFKEIYKRQIPSDTARALKIMRNDMMHTGEIMGIPESRREPRDTTRLEKYFKDFDISPQQVMTDVMRRIDLAVRFDQLMADMTLKLLGLEDSDIWGFPKIQNHFYFSGAKP